MRLRMILPVTALAVSGAFMVLPASAQQSGRSMNDGGFGPTQSAPSQSGVAQYSGTGQVVGTGSEGSSCAQRFHSFDPATGTYMGRDGQRHPCQ
jgi:BA14K-like protein